MTNQAFIMLLEELHSKEVNLLEKKAELYSKEDERMHSLMKMSELLKMKAVTVAFVLLTKHFVALQDWVFAREKERYNFVSLEQFRKVEEWIMDIRNYLALIYAMLYEDLDIEK